MVILTLEGSKLPLKVVEAGNSKTETVLAIVKGGACGCRSVWREEDGEGGEEVKRQWRRRRWNGR